MCTILIVEDDKATQNNIEILLWAEGYSVLTADNGLEALQVLESSMPDLIISDILMPYLSGTDFKKRLSQHENFRHIPFIFLSGMDDYSSIREGMSIGADDYIIKPFEFADLLQSIRIRIEKKLALNNPCGSIDNVKKYISHELNTPLVPIIGFSEVISEEFSNLADEEIAELAGKINKSGRKLRSKLDKVFAFIQLQTLKNRGGKSLLKESAIINNELLHKIAASCGDFLCSESSVNIKCKPAVLMIESRLLSIMLSELIENAIKYNYINGPVKIYGKLTGGRYSLAVMNSSYPSAAVKMKNTLAFNNDYNELVYSTGNGLGLKIVDEIRSAFGCGIEIKETPGNVASVIITFQTETK